MNGSATLQTAVASRQNADRLPFTLPPGLLGPSQQIESNETRSVGYDAIVGLSVANVSGTLVILGAPGVKQGDRTVPGTYVTLFTIASEAIDGSQVCIAEHPVKAEFIKLRYTNGATKQTRFEPAFHLVPIYSFKEVDADLVIGDTVEISGYTQVQNIETVEPLVAGASFTGAARDMLKYESFGISAYVDAKPAAAPNVTVIVENSSDGGTTWREVDSVTLTGGGAAGATDKLNRVYSVTRRHYRARLVNNDAVNALDVTELVTMQKPV